MIKRICILSLLTVSQLFSSCCCEGIIQSRTESIDEKLKSTNEENTKSLDKLLENIKTLNNDILEDRISNLDDNDIKETLKKFKINANNLYHANSLPSGLLYYQMKKDEFIKDNLISTISNQIDIEAVMVKTEMEKNKNYLHFVSKYLEAYKEEYTKSLFNVK